jgi:alpha-tubulin suppressor-like RCC1 family protein
VGNVNLGGKAVQIAAGEQHTCAILEGGAIRCWGLGATGRLGYGNSRNVGDDETPATMGDIELGGKAVGLALGAYHSCALLDNGAVRCWGFGLYGQLGYGQSTTIGDDETPASAGNVNIGGTARQIAAGAYHTCALLDSGAVRCWGYGIYGALGYGNTETIGNDETPASAGSVQLGGSAIAIAAGGHHTCAIMTSGAARCWGYGLHGVPGYSSVQTIGDNETPASAGDLTIGAAVTHLACGTSHSCAVSSDGVRCWGEGSLGRLGRATIDDIGDNETPAAGGLARILGP